MYLSERFRNKRDETRRKKIINAGVYSGFGTCGDKLWEQPQPMTEPLCQTSISWLESSSEKKPRLETSQFGTRVGESSLNPKPCICTRPSLMLEIAGGNLHSANPGYR